MAKILLVEDDVLIAQSVVGMLEQENFTVESVRRWRRRLGKAGDP